ASGWHITNLTTHNVVRVNGRSVPSGGTLSMQPQDILILGSTMLQLIAPQPSHPLGAPGLDGDSQDGDSQPDAVTDRLPLLKPVKPVVKPDYSVAKLSDAPTQWKSQKEESPSLAPKESQRADFSKLTPLPIQPEPELVAQTWDYEDEESLLGAGVTMQFALPQKMGVRMRWLIAGVGMAFLFVSAGITFVLNSIVGFTALTQNGVSSLVAALVIPAVPAIGINLLVNFI